MSTAMDLSIVVPFFNEEQSVIPLCRGVKEAVDPVGCDYEVLLVDDGSSDSTYENALKIGEEDSRFRIIKLRANFGQTAALAAGFSHARGRIIVSMDGDLQNDPRDIEEMIRRVDQGYDVVTGWRENRQDGFILRRLPSLVANWLVRKMTGITIRDNGCGIRAYRASYIQQFALYSEMHRLLPTIVALTGARITEMKVRHHPRKFGSSKYGLSRIYKFLLDFTSIKIILSLFRLPMFGFGAIGIFFVLLGLMISGVGIVELALRPEDVFLVYLGTGVLVSSLGVSLMVMGMICDLVYETAEMRVEHLFSIETNPGG